MNSSKIKCLFLLSFLLLQATGFLLAQTDCIYPGNDSAWVSGFNFPGTDLSSPQVMLHTDSALIVVGGSISFAGASNDILGIGLWNGVDWYPIMHSFNCPSCGYGYQESLTSDEDGNLYVGGFFTGVKNIDGSEIDAKNVTKYNASTGLWEPLGIGLETSNGRVEALLVKDGYLYAGGRITKAYNLTDTIAVHNLARYNLTTGIWEDVGGGAGSDNTSSSVAANGIVYALATDMAGSLLVGGGLEWVGSDHAPVYSIARWSEANGWDNFGGGLPSSYIPIVASRVVDIEVISGSTQNGVYAVGSFESIDNDNPVPEFFAKWTEGNGWQQVNITDFNSYPHFNNLDYNPTTQELYIGGQFTYPESDNIVSLDLENGNYKTFNGGTALATSTNHSYVNSIAEFNGDVYAGGASTEFGPNLSTNLLARWDGESWSALGNGVQATGYELYTVLQEGNEIYAVGYFAKMGGNKHFSIARFLVDEDRWDPTFNLDIYGSLTSNTLARAYTIIKVGDWLTIGGRFVRVNQTPVNNIFRYNVATDEIDPMDGGVGNSTTDVNSILQIGDSLVVGGKFESAGGESVNNLAVWDGTSWHGLDFPGTSPVRSLFNSGDTAIYAGGQFNLDIDGVTSRGIAAYQNGEWLNVGRGITSGTVFTMQRDPNTGYIVIGGSFPKVKQTDETVLAAEHLVYWDGNSYLPFENISENVNRIKYGPDSTLYICSNGHMSILGENFNCLARYKPSYGWAKFGSSLRNRLSPTPSGASAADITFSADGSVATVIGDFTFAGPHNSYEIARYVLDNPEELILVSAAFQPNINDGTVVFTNLTVNAIGYLWDFGDGETDDTANPTHTYENSGNYTVSLTAFNSCDTVTTTQELNIIVTGISEKSASEIQIYPNPAKDKITLSGMANRGLEQLFTATLFSAEGRIVATYTLNGTEKQELQLPTALESGIYFIALHGDSNTYTKRLIILK